MDNYLLAYIKQRMREMGFSKFHFEAVRVTEPRIEAYNQFYYLVSKTVPATLVITSDTNIFNEAVSYNSYNFYQIQEFTGLIEITQGVIVLFPIPIDIDPIPLFPIDLEFIKVVPVCNN